MLRTASEAEDKGTDYSMSSPSPTKPRGYDEDLRSSSSRAKAQLNDPQDDHVTYEELNDCDTLIAKQPTLCLSFQLEAVTILNSVKYMSLMLLFLTTLSNACPKLA